MDPPVPCSGRLLLVEIFIHSVEEEKKTEKCNKKQKATMTHNYGPKNIIIIIIIIIIIDIVILHLEICYAPV